MQVKRASKGLFLVALMLLASLSGCFGEDETVQEEFQSFSKSITKCLKMLCYGAESGMNFNC